MAVAAVALGPQPVAVTQGFRGNPIQRALLSRTVLDWNMEIVGSQAGGTHTHSWASALLERPRRENPTSLTLRSDQREAKGQSKEKLGHFVYYTTWPHQLGGLFLGGGLLLFQLCNMAGIQKQSVWCCLLIGDCESPWPKQCGLNHHVVQTLY